MIRVRCGWAAAALLVGAACSRRGAPAVDPVVGLWTEDSTEPFQFEFRSDGTYRASFRLRKMRRPVSASGHYVHEGNKLWLYDKHRDGISAARLASEGSGHVTGYYLTIGKGWIRLDSLLLKRGNGPWAPETPVAPTSLVGAWVEDRIRDPVRIEFRKDGTFVRTMPFRNLGTESVSLGRYSISGVRVRMYDMHFEGRTSMLPPETKPVDSGPGWIEIDHDYFHRGG